MKSLTLGYSPCPNDTFIFYALIHDKIDTKNLKFKETLLDVETLNQKALHTELDLTKISYHAFGHMRKNYCLLRAGGALGRGCGPLVIAKNEYAMEELRGKKIAIPGKLTTAYLLLQLYNPDFRLQTSDLLEMPFDKIIDAVAKEEVDAGLIIHESRFTYADHGLVMVADLGDWWEAETALPVPLAGICARADLDVDTVAAAEAGIRASVEYAFAHPEASREYVRAHSQELSDEVCAAHIALYVNEFSVDLGDEGRAAIDRLAGAA